MIIDDQNIDASEFENVTPVDDTKDSVDTKHSEKGESQGVGLRVNQWVNFNNGETRLTLFNCHW